MHRAVLQACLPAIIALGVSFALLTILVRFSGAKLNLKRLRNVSRCDRGSVHSLSLVLTLPLFVMIVLFILQISQLMVARIVVEYAAYAAARAAIVWVPAQTGEADHNPRLDDYDNPVHMNALPAPFRADNPVVLAYNRRTLKRAGGRRTNLWYYESPDVPSRKFAKVFEAAAIACAPMAPSRAMLPKGRVPNGNAVLVAQSLFRSMHSLSVLDPRIEGRVKNKIGYSFENTAVRLSFDDLHSLTGPTYNPRIPVRIPDTDEYYRVWYKNEVGWQDPLTVTVSHNLALLPGPGRFLARRLVQSDGQPDRVSGSIDRTASGYREPLYSVVIWASVRLTNQGLKSVVPYTQQRN
jgi:hypothetical protein